jgi:hypothetical protein
MRDFTLTVYKSLLDELIKAKYKFMTFAEFVETKPGEEKLIILRHDVDRLPEQALKMAKIEHEMRMKASYYFRCQHGDFAKNVIKDVAALKHEIGYHYETMDTCKGNEEKAWNEFKSNLTILRMLVPVMTICRHGSPRSKWDNGEIWKVHDYKALEIIGEPYLDIDFNEVLYLTDTGRRWDGDKFNIRDRVTGNGEERRQRTENRGQKEKECRDVVCDPPGFYLHSTGHIIKALKNNRLPDKIMLTIHPQRWTDNYFLWIEELFWQKIKNMIKYLKLARMKKISKK